MTVDVCRTVVVLKPTVASVVGIDVELAAEVDNVAGMVVDVDKAKLLGDSVSVLVLVVLGLALVS